MPYHDATCRVSTIRFTCRLIAPQSYHARRHHRRAVRRGQQPALRPEGVPDQREWEVQSKGGVQVGLAGQLAAAVCASEKLPPDPSVRLLIDAA